MAAFEEETFDKKQDGELGLTKKKPSTKNKMAG